MFYVFNERVYSTASCCAGRLKASTQKARWASFDAAKRLDLGASHGANNFPVGLNVGAVVAIPGAAKEMQTQQAGIDAAANVAPRHGKGHAKPTAHSAPVVKPGRFAQDGRFTVGRVVNLDFITSSIRTEGRGSAGVSVFNLPVIFIGSASRTDALALLAYA